MKLLKRFVTSLLLAFAALGLLVGAVLAQAEFSINVRKSFGYNSGSQIRGTFTVEAITSQQLQSVTFLIDGNPIKTVEAAPFKIQFVTTDYPAGWHELSAMAKTTDGKTVEAAVRRFQFVTAEEQNSGMAKILIPTLGLVAALFLVMIAFQFLLFRKRSRAAIPLGTARNYGIPGGAICPRCGRPTPLHWSAINLGIRSKLDFCDNCGRFGVLRQVSLAELRQAEAAEVADARPEAPIPEETPEEKLRRELDSSRYDVM